MYAWCYVCVVCLCVRDVLCVLRVRGVLCVVLYVVRVVWCVPPFCVLLHVWWCVVCIPGLRRVRGVCCGAHGACDVWCVRACVCVMCGVYAWRAWCAWCVLCVWCV